MLLSFCGGCIGWADSFWGRLLDKGKEESCGEEHWLLTVIERKGGEMKIMQCFGDLVANYAMEGVRVNTADNQQGDVYPSFIVRLSFVISSFKVGDR